MSEDNRMDRARRIRRMREGDDDRLEADEAGGVAPSDEPASPEESEGDADADGHESPASEDERDAIEDETEMEWGAPGGSTDTGAGSSSDSETQSASPSGTESASDSGTGSVAASDPDTGEAEASPAVTEAAAVPDDGGSGDISAPIPETDQLEAALAEADDEAETETVTPDAAEEAEAAEETEETRVLEFTLHDEHYCLDIQYIEEIVKEETITRVPNTPEFVEGVVDLRGQITTILNPKVAIDKPEAEAGELIVVFDSDAFDDQGHIGWVVDDVRQVSLISAADINEPPIAEDHVNGVIDREDDDEFVVWTSPDLVFDEAGA